LNAAKIQFKQHMLSFLESGLTCFNLKFTGAQVIFDQHGKKKNNGHNNSNN
jgi:hypothetical protein